MSNQLTSYVDHGFTNASRMSMRFLGRGSVCFVLHWPTRSQVSSGFDRRPLVISLDQLD